MKSLLIKFNSVIVVHLVNYCMNYNVYSYIHLIAHLAGKCFNVA